jgi:hypothetical protein
MEKRGAIWVDSKASEVSMIWDSEGFQTFKGTLGKETARNSISNNKNDFPF